MLLSFFCTDPALREAVANAEFAAQAKLATLTRREREVLFHVVEGHPNKIIAYRMGLSKRTIENHRSRIFEKTGARSTIALIRLVVTAGGHFGAEKTTNVVST